MRVIVFAPAGTSASETFVRANVQQLPHRTTPFYGNLYGWQGSWLQLLYAWSNLAAKGLQRLGLQRAATMLVSGVALLIVRRLQPDCLIAEFGFHAVLVMEAAHWSGVPLIVQFRGADLSAGRYLRPLRHRYGRLLQLADAVIVKSEPMRQRLLSLGAVPELIRIGPSGADAALFHGADPALTPPRFLAVGRFVPKKGPIHTLAAFRALAERIPEAELVMVGAGPLLPQARECCRQWGLEHRVQFPGARSHETVADLMRGARAFVQHSLTAPDGDQEGSPVAVMEAQLSGLPVVATRHGGIPEVVIDGVTGLLAEEGDVAAMAAAMERLARDPALAARLGSAGRERCTASFTLNHHLALLAALIEEVVHRKETPR